MRNAFHSAAVALAAFAATACGSSAPAVGPTAVSLEGTTSGVLKTLQIAPSRVECTGVTEQSCLQVRESAEGQWTRLFEEIVGFDYEPGYLYEIRIKEEAVANPPADASSIKRTLVSILSKTAASSSLIGPTWRLTSIGGRAVLPGVRVTAVFDASNRVSGSSGCNRYFGGATAAGDRLDVGLLAGTRMYCGADGVMDQESAYLAALEKAESFRIVGNELRLLPASGAVSLTFQLE